MNMTITWLPLPFFLLLEEEEDMNMVEGSHSLFIPFDLLKEGVRDKVVNLGS